MPLCPDTDGICITVGVIDHQVLEQEGSCAVADFHHPAMNRCGGAGITADIESAQGEPGEFVAHVEYTARIDRIIEDGIR